jgi:long-chain fatty acid transport protein
MRYALNFAFVTAVSAIILPHRVEALGFRVTDLATEATARGGAFVATADDPSAIYHNPAGITQLDGLQSLLGANTINFQTSVNLDTPSASFDSKYATQVVPHSYATLKPAGSPVAFGLGAYSPFGLALEFDDSVPFRTLAKKGMIQYATWNPVVAWQVCDSLSIAAGATINYSRTMLARGVIVPGDEFNFKGAGIGYGFNLGLLWQPLPQHSFGVTYFSATDIDYSGHSHLRIPSFDVPTPIGVFHSPQFKREEDADATINYPGTLRAGYSFRPTPDWNLEVDVEWTDWDRLNTVTLHQPSGAVAVPFNYESSFFYEFGVTRKLPWNLAVSAGYIYSENSVPNESFNPLVPDSNRHVVSAGLARHCDRYSFAVGYQYAYGPHRDISQGTLADGDYRFESHAVSFSLGYRF